MLATIQELETAVLPVDKHSLSFKRAHLMRYSSKTVHFTQAGWYLTMCVTHAMLTAETLIASFIRNA